MTVVRENTNGANGMTLSRDGRLLVCEQGTPSERARISAVDRTTGARRSAPQLAERHRRGKRRFDLVHRPELRLPAWASTAHGDYVYRFAHGQLTVVEDTFDKPNGLAFSPDESVLYIGDSGANHEPRSFEPRRPHHIRAFDVADGSRLENGRALRHDHARLPDGIKVDADGRVYSSSFSGIQIFSPQGRLLEEILLPGAVNFAFGGSTLYVTTDTAIWAAKLSAKGA